jgi:hypothetical protein
MHEHQNNRTDEAEKKREKEDEMNTKKTRYDGV